MQICYQQENEIKLTIVFNFPVLLFQCILLYLQYFQRRNGFEIGFYGSEGRVAKHSFQASKNPQKLKSNLKLKKLNLSYLA